MSPVNQAGLVSEILPRHSFLCKISICVHMRGRAGLVIYISVFATEISVTGKKISHSLQPGPGKLDETFLTKYLRHVLLCISTSKVCELALSVNLQ